ncbi:MAG: ribonuclease Z [Candidatus Lokiarchaeota archaeon]|nr:ribonuclease Z [Candidatus Lokiarchaeota archaeon]
MYEKKLKNNLVLMKLVILGSSAAIPVKDRNLSSVALNYKNKIILFDCGEDVQRKFIEAGLKLNKNLVILISHFHGDHIIGLPGLLFRFGLIDRTAPVSIIGPKNLYLYLYLHRKILGLKANYPFMVYEIDHQNNKIIEYEGLNSDTPKREVEIKKNVVYETKRFLIKYAVVLHSIQTFAYAFVEKPRNGKFNPERALKLGIPPSRLWKRMQEGDVIEYEGKTIDPVKEGVVGPKRLGRKVTYSGDTAPCESLINLGKDSDVIIHEATFSKDKQDVAIEKQHSTSVDAATDAKKMSAKQLILTHISSRYQGDASKLLEEAKKIFPNAKLAKDLMRLTLK